MSWDTCHWAGSLLRSYSREDSAQRHHWYEGVRALLCRAVLHPGASLRSAQHGLVSDPALECHETSVTGLPRFCRRRSLLSFSLPARASGQLYPQSLESPIDPRFQPRRITALLVIVPWCANILYGVCKRISLGVSLTSRRLAMSFACSSWMYFLCSMTCYERFASELLRLPTLASWLSNAAVFSFSSIVIRDMWRMLSSVGSYGIILTAT